MTNGFLQGAAPDVIKGPFDIGIQNPRAGGVGPCETKDFPNRIVATPARAKAVANPLEPYLLERLQGVFHHGLNASILVGMPNGL